LNRIELLITKIQNKFKDYCEFQNICPAFDPANFTCANKGGSHCGKYRRFQKEKTINKQSEPKEAV
jgi:hypothetical protein